MPSRRLDDRIRKLCEQALAADDTNLSQVLAELRAALHEHARRMREMAARKLVVRKKNAPPPPENEPCTPTLEASGN